MKLYVSVTFKKCGNMGFRPVFEWCAHKFPDFRKRFCYSGNKRKPRRLFYRNSHTNPRKVKETCSRPNIEMQVAWIKMPISSFRSFHSKSTVVGQKTWQSNLHLGRVSNTPPSIRRFLMSRPYFYKVDSLHFSFALLHGYVLFLVWSIVAS